MQVPLSPAKPHPKSKKTKSTPVFPCLSSVISPPTPNLFATASYEKTKNDPRLGKANLTESGKPITDVKKGGAYRGMTGAFHIESYIDIVSKK